MKIVFTGGGTGGHFYPVIAVAQKVNEILDEENIIGTKLYYISTDPYDKELLFENRITFEKIETGKMRIYFSFQNFIDLFKTFFGMLNGIYTLFSIYPDVVFGKGGYASFPTLFAARILHIPVIIHESDSASGRVNKWAGKFATRVAVSFKEAFSEFPEKKTAWIGQPIRKEIEQKASKEEALKYFKLESRLPTILILGGSQGAEFLNNTILDSLPRLVENYQVIHQTGVSNFKSVAGRADVVLSRNENKVRYYPHAFLNSLGMKMAAGVADIIISRAGSTIFEIASWGVPSIIVPFRESNADHARKNAFSYAHAGACSVIEEQNMTANILCSEVDRILGDKETYERMVNSTKNFHKPDAALKIARELIDIALEHEK
ncbi:MAG: UDP-N-acetylglucosamine--N-acetylmuramyl-(pentapeptide) pyrophosphoryl-undecaprenol N-acetylglucosamine transferase [Candidatus Paceibacterota bacterium]|jgi:UDP-N-acetylglucosamine--N-acetylmuramyl-(pentapeptide) pyrophosphoryl-undecaprenol N-acetylglucosamine transferase